MSDTEFEGMGRKEAQDQITPDHFTIYDDKEWSEPFSIEDWQSTQQAKETVSEAYFEASEILQEQLKTVPVNAANKPFTEIERRATLERHAFRHIDCAMDDAYQEYVAMHPRTIGHMTETFSRIYGEDGI